MQQLQTTTCIPQSHTCLPDNILLALGVSDTSTGWSACTHPKPYPGGNQVLPAWMQIIPTDKHTAMENRSMYNSHGFTYNVELEAGVARNPCRGRGRGLRHWECCLLGSGRQPGLVKEGSMVRVSILTLGQGDGQSM
jgi:hypothetical protein